MATSFDTDIEVGKDVRSYPQDHLQQKHKQTYGFRIIYVDGYYSVRFATDADHARVRAEESRPGFEIKSIEMISPY